MCSSRIQSGTEARGTEVKPKSVLWYCDSKKGKLRVVFTGCRVVVVTHSGTKVVDFGLFASTPYSERSESIKTVCNGSCSTIVLEAQMNCTSKANDKAREPLLSV